MNTTNTRFTVIVLAMLVTGAIGTYAATQQGDLAQETGPVYSVEGAWYGIVTIEGLGTRSLARYLYLERRETRN
jgi:hypothetical protein